MKKTISCFAMIVALAIGAFANDTPPDEKYIKEFETKDVNIRLDISHQSFGFNVKDRDNDRNLSFAPAVVWDCGFSGNYKNFGLAFSIATDVGADPKKGDSKYYDVQLNYFTRGWGADIYFQKYKGFYLDNKTTQENKELNGDYKQLPNLDTRYIGLNYYFLFNKNFSYGAAFEQTEKQQKWAGSFILMASLINYNLKNDGSILFGEDTLGYYQDLPGLKEINFFGLGLSIGYAYTFTLGDFYLTPSLLLGNIPQHQEFKTSDDTKSRWMFLNVKVHFKVALGYNGDSFFIGSFFIVDSNLTHYQNVDITCNSVNFSVFTGIRL